MAIMPGTSSALTIVQRYQRSSNSIELCFQTAAEFGYLLMLCFVAGFVSLKIPTMTASFFSGHVDGHASGLSGLVTAVVARALWPKWTSQ